MRSIIVVFMFVLRLLHKFHFLYMKNDIYIVCISQGDSGGPLVCRNENGDVIQVGVASFTSKDNPDRFPAVFTQVSDFVDWIKRYIRT